MTNQELIAKLSKCKPESEAVIQYPFSVVKHITDIKETEHGFTVIYFTDAQKKLL